MCVCVPPTPPPPLADCSLKVKDVLREFDADGSLARHRHGEVSSVCSPADPLLEREALSAPAALHSAVKAAC